MTDMTLQAVRQLIANDSYAITFQSVEQYRGTLLRHFDSLVESPVAAPAAQHAESGAQGGGVKTWKQRMDEFGHYIQGEQIHVGWPAHVEARDAEIADLRKALAAQSQGAQAAIPRELVARVIERLSKAQIFPLASELRAALAAKAEAPAAQQAAAPGALNDDTAEGIELLDTLIDNIAKDGNYGAEATLTFLGQIRQCFTAPSAPGTPEALDAARYRWLCQHGHERMPQAVLEAMDAAHYEGEPMPKDLIDQVIDKERAAQLDGGQ